MLNLYWNFQWRTCINTFDQKLFSFGKGPLLQTIVQIWEKTKREPGVKRNAFLVRMTHHMNFGDLEMRDWQML